MRIKNDSVPVTATPPKKSDGLYNRPFTLYIKTIYGDTYEINDVYNYGYHENSEHYWYTTTNDMYAQNFVRARTILYFGIKDYAIKEITE